MIREDSSTVPQRMKAAVFNGSGGPEVIEIQERDIPQPDPGHLLIKVHASGINPADVGQREGNYHPPEGVSDIPGLEVSGEVVGHGRGVSENAWPLGAQVVALIDAGGYAEFVTAPVAQTLSVPKNTSVVDAAALMEVAATVYSNLAMVAQLAADESVLVHGGSGGIGTFALQWLACQGHTVFSTGSSEEKLDWARRHGATYAINYTEDDFVERIKELTEGRGVDVILDVVGGPYVARNVKCLATGGRMVTIGLGGGRFGDLDMGRMMMKRLSVNGTTLRARPAEEKAAIVAAVGQHVWPLIESGDIAVPLDSVFPLAQTRAAHTYFSEGKHRGKVVLLISES